MLNILVNGAIINSKIKTEWNSTGNLSMKLSDTHVKCVIKKRNKSRILCSILRRHVIGEDIPVKIDVITAIIKQDGKSILKCTALAAKSWPHWKSLTRVKISIEMFYDFYLFKIKSDLDFHFNDSVFCFMFRVVKLCTEESIYTHYLLSQVSHARGSGVKRPPSLAHHLGRWIIPFGMIQLPGWPRDVYFASRGRPRDTKYASRGRHILHPEVGLRIHRGWVQKAPSLS